MGIKNMSETVCVHSPDHINIQASEFCKRAQSIMDDRGKEYEQQDSKERSMEQAVDAFNSITGHELTETQGWLFMCVLKMVRSQNNPGFHYDSYLDLIAYASLAGESASKATPESV